MKRIGRVVHISPGKRAVVKAGKIPKIGNTVVDGERRRVGTVFDVIGSTSSPYVEVEVMVEDPESFVNKDLFFLSSPKKELRSRKR